jgi:plasmid stabilization system protein ParE
MSLPIVYTSEALETLTAIYNFISNKFGVNSADRFVLQAEKTINLIAEFPLMFKASSIDEKVRVGFISKQTSLFYKINSTSITLLYFWDNRQDTIIK